MSEGQENQTQTMAPVEVNAAANANTVNKGKYNIIREEFTKGDKKGFHFYRAEYLDLDYAAEKVGKGDINAGKALLLGMVNNAISLNMRNRANSRMPQPEQPDGMSEEDYKALVLQETQARIQSNQTELVSEKEAEEYIPGTREKTSLLSLQKEVQAINTQIKKLIGQGKNAEALELVSELKELKEKIVELEKKQEDELMQLLEASV